ncbi:MAG TPA: hypothetical protein VHC20_00695 [Candidatus Paceibacterota bacterium]|nr:hypothetical protein [Candidatus Paceibacterota bacterium]
MATGLIPWRVRVKRAVEDWVEVEAPTALAAEAAAANLPGVAFVFTQSAIRGDKPVGVLRPQGVEELPDEE